MILNCYEHKGNSYCIKMESQKPIKLPKKTSSNNDLSKKEKIRKNPKEIKIEKPMLSISVNHVSTV